jgi:putative ABC transport system permease protein
VLVAAAAFTVLTAASQTAQVRTTGTVSANFAPAYDILVRPRGGQDRGGEPDRHRAAGLPVGHLWRDHDDAVPPDPAGPGVQVAAPIAMVGYAQLSASRFVPVPAAALAGSGRQLYRISTTWVSDNGASRVTQPPSYLYVTPLRLWGSADVGDTPATDGANSSASPSPAP